MSTKPPKYSYILAVLYGSLAFFIPSTEGIPLILALFFLCGGGLIGFLWPFKTWRGGLWIAGPMLALSSLSVLFAGQLEVFLKKDLPFLMMAIGAACLGGFIAAWLKSRMVVNL